MTKLPIALCMFTTTKGHWGRRDLYLETLNLMSRLVPLSDFGARYVHIKVSPGEEALAEQMRAELITRGFHVDQTVGSWSHGNMSHQNEYLRDMNKASQSPVLHSQPYMLLLEDDSPFLCRRAGLVECLSRMIGFLEGDINVVSTRLLWRSAFDGGVPNLRDQHDYFFSPHFDFQPSILRPRDYMIANKVIEQNWEQVKHAHCEMVMRMALDTVSRSQYRHVVLKPDYAEPFHLGGADHLEAVAKARALFLSQP